MPVIHIDEAISVSSISLKDNAHHEKTEIASSLRDSLLAMTTLR